MSRALAYAGQPSGTARARRSADGSGRFRSALPDEFASSVGALECGGRSLPVAARPRNMTGHHRAALKANKTTNRRGHRRRKA